MFYYFAFQDAISHCDFPSRIDTFCTTFGTDDNVSAATSQKAFRGTLAVTKVDSLLRATSEQASSSEW